MGGRYNGIVEIRVRLPVIPLLKALGFHLEWEQMQRGLMTLDRDGSIPSSMNGLGNWGSETLCKRLVLGFDSPQVHMNTKQKGDRTTGAVFAALMRAGKTVLMPFGENQRYDLVIEEAGRFVRVQCKTGRLSKNEDVIEFNTCSSHYHQGGKSQNYRGQVELFGVYCEGFGNRVWLVPVEEVGKYNGYLRLGQPKNGQSKNIRWARRFEV